MLQKTFYCNRHTITEFGMIDSKNSFTAYVVLYELIDTWFLDSNIVCSTPLLAPRKGLYTASLVSLKDAVIGWSASDYDAPIQLWRIQINTGYTLPSPTWRASPTWRKQKAFPLPGTAALWVFWKSREFPAFFRGRGQSYTHRHGTWNSLTRKGGWEFDRSHGAGTFSPSHWQQVEEQAPKPVGWMMCFLLMTFVPAQKLCVNIYIYIYIYICFFYMSSIIGRIYTYNRSVIQYWWSCTPSHFIGL